MTEFIEGFQHRFEPGSAGPSARPTLLMLHGTGGNENDLVPLGKELWPGAAILSPRGQVLERGMPRFFRRLAEGVFDQEDLALRTDQLARFITAAAKQYRFDPAGVIAVGFSNGANVAASLMLRHPGVLAGAVLYRAMVPFEPSGPLVLPATPVWLGAGRFDPIIPAENVQRLADILQSAGAKVTLDWRDEGHNLTQEEVEAAAAWLRELSFKP
jgi:predicted esterase